MLLIAAIASVPSAALGLAYAYGESYGGELSGYFGGIGQLE